MKDAQNGQVLKKCSNYIMFCLRNCFVVMEFNFFFHYELFSEFLGSKIHYIVYANRMLRAF
jgi:hypothetical protein